MSEKTRFYGYMTALLFVGFMLGVFMERHSEMGRLCNHLQEQIKDLDKRLVNCHQSIVELNDELESVAGTVINMDFNREDETNRVDYLRLVVQEHSKALKTPFSSHDVGEVFTRKKDGKNYCILEILGGNEGDFWYTVVPIEHMHNREHAIAVPESELSET